MTITEIIQQRPTAGSPENDVMAMLRQEQAAHPFFPLPYFADALVSGNREDLHKAALYAPQRHLLKAWMQGQLPEMAAPRQATGTFFTAIPQNGENRPAVCGEPFAILHFESPQVVTGSPVLSIAPTPRTASYQPYLNSLLQIKQAKYIRLLPSIREQMLQTAPHIAAESVSQVVEKEMVVVPPVVTSAAPQAEMPVVVYPTVAPAKRKIRRAVADELLDQFLETNPTIGKSYSPYTEVSTPESVQRSVEDDPSLVTETLARIYERQGRFEDAIGIYQKLCLLFPKKQAYFEGKIQQLTTV